MQIVLKKINPLIHELRITRKDQSYELEKLNTETFLVHDICHLFVEMELQTLDGFWGMLSKGYRMEQLTTGKPNPLTQKLRIIERIVGAIQSVYLNRMTESDFWVYMQTVNWDFKDQLLLHKVISKVDTFMQTWRCLPIRECVQLNFEINLQEQYRK